MPDKTGDRIKITGFNHWFRPQALAAGGGFIKTSSLANGV
jgi:hypothetical protein